MTRKRTLSLAAAVLATTLGAAAVIGTSSANATPSAAGNRVARQLAASSRVLYAWDRDDQQRRNADRKRRHEREVWQAKQAAARKAKVVTAVLRKFPHARILSVTPAKDATFVVRLVLRDHRTGVVKVDRTLRVGKFTLVRRVAATPHATTPTYHAPTYHAPTYHAPTYHAPTYHAPAAVYRAPVQVQLAPANALPAQSAPKHW